MNGYDGQSRIVLSGFAGVTVMIDTVKKVAHLGETLLCQLNRREWVEDHTTADMNFRDETVHLSKVSDCMFWLRQIADSTEYQHPGISSTRESVDEVVNLFLHNPDLGSDPDFLTPLLVIAGNVAAAAGCDPMEEIGRAATSMGVESARFEGYRRFGKDRQKNTVPMFAALAPDRKKLVVMEQWGEDHKSLAPGFFFKAVPSGMFEMLTSLKMNSDEIAVLVGHVESSGGQADRLKELVGKRLWADAVFLHHSTT